MPKEPQIDTTFCQFRRPEVLNLRRIYERNTNASMTEMKRNRTSDASMPFHLIHHFSSMTTAHKLISKVFSDFIRTFTWTAFFPVAAAEPVPVELPPAFASLLIFVEITIKLLSLGYVAQNITSVRRGR